MITISFSFAWIFFAVMVAGFMMMIGGSVVKDKEWLVPLGFMCFFGGDVLNLFGSIIYMSHPTNGDVYQTWGSKGCAQFNYSIYTYDPIVPCIEPTMADNPYEQQPLHPLAWMAGWINEFGRFITGAVSIKVR